MGKQSVLTADENKEVNSRALSSTLALHTFKLVLYFNRIIISNQIKYYLPINRDNFLQMQCGFYRHALQIHYQL